MQIVNLAALSVFIASSLAADCYGTEGIASRFIEGYWDARQKMCSNTECAYQQPCTVTTWKKYTAIGSSTIKIEISRKNTAGKAGFKDCWDATENIINQCIRDGDVYGGVWQANGQLYTMTSYGDVRKIIEDVFKIIDILKTIYELVNNFIKRWTPAMAVELLGAYPRVQVTDGTGQWILKNYQYRKWEQSRNGVLWINGLRCGKTGLAITIDDRFRARQHHQEPTFPAIQIAIVFCYHQIDGMRNLQDHMEILMSLWVQLVKSKPECRPDIAWINKFKDNHYTAIPTGKRRVKVQKELLQYALKHSGNTVLILDGLDEVPRTLQRRVIEDLRDIQRGNDDCRILITSRPYDSIARIFKNDPQVYMDAPDIDLTLYMEERFSRQDWDCHCEFKSLDIIKILLKKCQKSFILTQLIMDEVERADSKAHCERIISKLPATVDEAYRRGLNRLKAESSSDGLVDGLPCMSIQALFWVAFAPRPITGDQLEHALAIADSNPNSVSKVRMWRYRGIDSQTGKLVVVDPEYGRLVIAHKTLTSYLKKDETRFEFFLTIQEHIHEVQLNCLLADHTKSRVPAETKAKYLQQYPLLTYALSNWGTALERVLEPNTPLWRNTEAFLGTSFHEWNDIIKHQIIKGFMEKIGTPHSLPHVTRQQIVEFGSIDGLYWLVIFNLQGLVPFWIDVNTEGFDDVSPLDLTFNSFRYRESKVLISYFPGLNGTSAEMLQFLVRSGRVEDLRDAIRGGIDINHPCENGKRALDYALEMENEEIAELLRNNTAISNLHWPAEKTEVCPYPMNLREPIATPLISKEKDYDQEEMMSDGGIQEDLILEIPIHTKHPIRSIVFETITAARDECTEDRFRRPYMGLNRSGLSVALENQDGTRQIFTVQDNLHEIFVQGNLQDSEDFRLHTNIWNLSELDAWSTEKARFMRSIRESSILQIAAYSTNPSCYNRVKYIRVRMYGEEIHPSTQQ
ncbi:hypothetical protein FAUST_10743 [Fusarium austroamericanum]|uniref:Nephrocystin 3-like N-terminal domain-containing protein n=1 Tax=Fusarium austroamericanum TaxID=282268 RepID=A0AAN5Z0A3_FUSAU|nr:hypothetical protein FAUST_10743 [Fusarium austroamericanum]